MTAPLSEAPPPAAASRVLSALRTLVGVVFVAAAASGVAWSARRHVMSSRRFAVTDIDVVGSERRTREAVIGESGLALGVNVFTLDLDTARARLLADPWISEATLARRLPGTLLVSVTERKAAALVALGDTYLASADGEPFKVIEPGDPIDLPIVTGVTPQSLADDREGAVRTIRRAVDLAFEYEHGPLARRAALEEVHVSPDGTFALVVGPDATRLLMGGPPFRRKLDQAMRVVLELDKRTARADTIMLDNDTRPERVVVRVR
jgi:cell division protein FtsQ